MVRVLLRSGALSEFGVLPADTPTTDSSIDLCREQLHVPVIQPELLPCD